MTSAAEGWIDVLPKGWYLVPAKAAFTERREPNWPDDVHLTPSQIHGVLPQAEYMAKTGNSVVQNIQGQDNMKHVEPDDFIIHLRSFQGGIERSKYSGKVSTAYTVLKPSDRVVPSYFRWLLKSNGYIQELRTTTNQLRDGQSIKFADFAKVQLPCPPRSKQRAIADYLDRETARIDTLIEEQQRLIEMLRERRRVLVTRAVCFGVDEDVELRDSGDSVVGLVPRHWTVKAVRHWMESLDGQRIPLSGEERADRRGGFDYYGASGVIDQVDGYLFDEPLVLVSEDGANLLMRSTPIAFAAKGRYWVNNHAHVLRPLGDGDVDFWAQRLEALDVTTVVSGATQPKLTAGALMGLRVSAPDGVDEQRRIAAYLAEQTSKIDVLIAESELFVELSRERRTALISAAVTGQIDVREAA
ncbi:MAG: restriction endonuclease subunit S [Rhodococcus sp. (in: high G+C Gram-positive bacteria)]|uniref:restriction endonuclease subunit S n=1 Tax=Rhodococcus sp. TaxID=1831 RepID=UPI003BB07BEE